jgi:hypothetical protein
MPSLLPGNETPSKRLKDWPPPNSIPRPVGGLSGPPGTPDDTWESVARQYGFDVQQLIRFNFKTNNPKEVNWYLRTYVGCNTPSPSRWNWTFKGAKPGIIYIPGSRVDFDQGSEIEGEVGVKDFVWKLPSFELADPTWAKWLLVILHDLHSLHEVSELAGVNLFELGEFFSSPTIILSIVTRLIESWGEAVTKPIEETNRDQYFEGISYGIVLGADKRPSTFIRNNAFRSHPVHNVVYPQFDRLAQQFYSAGFVLGLAYGRRMNARQSGRFQVAVRSHMDLDKFPAFSDEDAWSTPAFKVYYQEASIAFRRYLLQYLLRGSLQDQL